MAIVLAQASPSRRHRRSRASAPSPATLRAHQPRRVAARSAMPRPPSAGCGRAWPARRRRSSAVTSLAVSTTTGMSRHSGRSRKDRRKPNPSRSRHFRHHQVEEDQAGLAHPDRLQAGEPVLGRCYPPALAGQHGGHALAHVGVVVDHQDRALVDGGPEALHRLLERPPLDRLVQVVGGPREKARFCSSSTVTMMTGVAPKSGRRAAPATLPSHPSAASSRRGGRRGGAGAAPAPARLGRRRRWRP